ncbi:Ectonucleotide pyrophosphatase/phosphodiesterase family member 6 [Nymphon striatum]|nr:Ectonucleotide pyrophosphatase/phosphodiesterase family member 6 [Nymphon striatum]KAG1663054.1 Ectonucleotide pyrophosphatase/phosphodiesterase family member 6 [Nymphon striatum]
MGLHSSLFLNGWKKLRSLGTVAEYMLPVFPADSYPNWNSITTGIQRLYPESHEHPFNYLYNQEKGDFFLQHPHPNVSHSHWWQAAEPIWITAEKYYRKTAVFGWGGCEVQINNSRPWYCDQYINRNPEEELLYFKTSVNKAIDLLTNKKIDFAMVYNQLLDMQAHKYGANSLELDEALVLMDEQISNLMTQLKRPM